MSIRDEVIELLYKAKGVDNSEIESIAYEIDSLYNPSNPVENLINKYIYFNFDYTLDDLKTKSKKGEIVKARQIAMFLLFENTIYSLTKIGSMFDKDHNNVIHSKKVVLNYMSTDKEYRKLVETIQLKIDEEIQKQKRTVHVCLGK